MPDITRIIESLRDGDDRAADRLLTAVYDELRRLAAIRLSKEKPGQTLQATALVHEAYLRLIGDDREVEVDFENRAHFFGAAAEAMRRILIENARRTARPKHGGDRVRQDLDAADLVVEPAPTDLLALDEALTKLEASDPQKAELVKLRYFAGLTAAQAAEILGISKGTADRHWAFARAWLLTEIEGGEGGQEPR